MRMTGLHLATNRNGRFARRSELIHAAWRDRSNPPHRQVPDSNNNTSTMLNPDYIPDQVLTELLEAKELPDDDKGYSVIAKLTVYEAFDTWLKYNGFLGYTTLIMDTLDGLRDAEAKASWNSDYSSSPRYTSSCYSWVYSSNQRYHDQNYKPRNGWSCFLSTNRKQHSLLCISVN